MCSKVAMCIALRRHEGGIEDNWTFALWRTGTFTFAASLADTWLWIHDYMRDDIMIDDGFMIALMAGSLWWIWYTCELEGFPLLILGSLRKERVTRYHSKYS